jgi:ATP-dependent protease ClpP protease subunit
MSQIFKDTEYNVDVLTGEIDRETFESYADSTAPHLTICSHGGDISYMLAMFDCARVRGVNTSAFGIVQSAAVVLLQAGTVRYMARNALLKFHAPEAVPTLIKDPQTNETRTEDKIPDDDWLLYTLMVGLIADRTGMHEVEVHGLYDGNFINAQRALELNLIDKIVEAPVIPVYHDAA